MWENIWCSVVAGQLAGIQHPPGCELQCSTGASFKSLTLDVYTNKLVQYLLDFQKVTTYISVSSNKMRWIPQSFTAEVMNLNYFHSSSYCSLSNRKKGKNIFHFRGREDSFSEPAEDIQ